MKPNTLQVFFFQLILITKEFFEVSSEDNIQLLDAAVKEYAYYILKIDQLVDGENKIQDLEKDNNVLYTLTRSHESAVKKLTILFPKGSTFWENLDTYSKRYFDLLIYEKKFSIEKPYLTFEEYETICNDKHVLSLIPIFGMGELFKPKYPIDELIILLEHIFTAMQLNDDIEDFNKDETDGQWNLAQSKTDQYIMDNNLENVENVEKFREKVFYLSGLAEIQTEMALKKFIEAKHLSEKYDLFQLKNWCQQAIAQTHFNLNIAQNLAAQD